MNRDREMFSGSEPAMFGRGSGGCTIKQLKAEMDAAMDRMGLAHTHGQGSAWGRGARAAGRERPRMLGHMTRILTPVKPELNGEDIWSAL